MIWKAEITLLHACFYVRHSWDLWHHSWVSPRCVCSLCCQDQHLPHHPSQSNSLSLSHQNDLRASFVINCVPPSDAYGQGSVVFPVLLGNLSWLPAHPLEKDWRARSTPLISHLQCAWSRRTCYYAVLTSYAERYWCDIWYGAFFSGWRLFSWAINFVSLFSVIEDVL